MAGADHSDNLDEFLAAAQEVALAAGALIRQTHDKRHESALSVEAKGATKLSVDLVTATDKAAEELIISTLRARFPTHAFVGEESYDSASAGEGPLPLGAGGEGEGERGTAAAAGGAAAYTWIIDPLDGTTNFVHGWHAVTVSIGLARGSELVAGVIYNPLLGDMCAAAKGRGTTLNGSPVRVGAATGVGDAIVVNNFGPSRDAATNALHCRRIEALLNAQTRGVRNTGSAAQNMMDVACGKLDAYFEDGFGGPWDVAAGYVAVMEAGGVCSAVSGAPFELLAGKGNVICGNAAVVADVARVLATVKE